MENNKNKDLALTVLAGLVQFEKELLACESDKKGALVMSANLLAEMARCKLTQYEMAKEIGICTKAMSNKVLGKVEFTRREMVAIRDILKAKTGKPLTMDYLFEE